MDVFNRWAGAYHQQTWTALASVAIVLGWFLTYWLNRRLQRKKAAEEFLRLISSSEELITARTAVFYVIHTQENYPWWELRERVLRAKDVPGIPKDITRLSKPEPTNGEVAKADAPTANPADIDLYLKFLKLLNLYEYACAAMLQGVMYPGLLKAVVCTELVLLYTSAKDFIEKRRKPLYHLSRHTHYENLEYFGRLWDWNKPDPWIVRIWRNFWLSI